MLEINRYCGTVHRWTQSVCDLATTAAFGAFLFLLGPHAVSADGTLPWSTEELYGIRTLSIAGLRPLSPDETNRVADDPKAAALGQKLFFDPRFSANGEVSCSSCHMPDQQFQDGRQVGHGIKDVKRRTPTLVGSAYSPFQFWDGRKDSQWSQALGPLESAAEHGADRTMIVQVIAENYREEFEAVFGAFPDFGILPPHASPLGSPKKISAWTTLKAAQRQSVNVIFSNMGKAIAAFERTIPVPITRFDDFAAAIEANDLPAANKIFRESERNGLKLFLGGGDCLRCHKGPLFTDMQFYNLGLPDMTTKTDSGRSPAAYDLKNDPFNCLGDYSDSSGSRGCLKNQTILYDLTDDVGAFKSPTLRGVAQRPPYMHNGKFATLRDVLKHYNEPPKALFGVTKLLAPLKLTDQQLTDLELFLKTLDTKD